MVCTETDSVKTTSFFLICATLTQLQNLTMSSDNAYVESIAESIVREYLSRKVTTYVCSKTVAVQNTSLCSRTLNREVGYCCIIAIHHDLGDT